MTQDVEADRYDQSSEDSVSDCAQSIPKRFLLLFMVFLGFTTMYALRVNLNVAIGAMVNNHTVHVDGKQVEKVWDI